MNMTQRLSLAFSLLAGSLIILGIVTISLLSGFQARFEYVQVNTIDSLKVLNRLVDESNRLSVALYRHQTEDESGKLASLETVIQKRIVDISTLTKYYFDNDITNDEDRAMTDKSLRLIDAVKQSLPAFLTASRSHQNQLSLALLSDDEGIGGAISQLKASYRNQFEFNSKIGEALRQQNQHIYQLTKWGMVAGIALAIIGLGMLTILTIMRVRHSLNAIGELMERASTHLDLSLKADDSRRDEVGIMARSYNRLMESISAALHAVSSASQSVSSASGQIAAGNEDLSARTEEQAASLEQTAASMTQISETVRQTADNTRQASHLAENTRSLSDTSSAALNTMLETMQAIRDSSGKVGEIITLIEGIAFQTNILALNAAVEAARAGEHGRGFAVVAGEVRNLSQRSTTAAREIKALIQSSNALIESGTSQADNVNHNMETMRGAVSQVTDLVNEIAAAATEQSQGISQVHQAVNQMDDVTQQNAALVEEASAASLSLQEQADTLAALVRKFTLAGPQAAVVMPRAKPAAVVASRPALALAAGGQDNWQSF
ncbi:MCP four helix bundle domain-containing protein [Pantoea allii]|uniref:MCP four helix bundle domain-containing protein n=1 Tax=Pantoea allii TaxID=574096 RepID=A0ABS6VBE9_9GAMM|nr:methyl-accepting chemotaxis protein [Pantoea allii]MBW1213046.1 MCP four helix bundle domain-containing protein [Pantoea allii]MBW1256636.1 MCP four helix bundle domain-containing protein [Pantoea allii]MBW1265718.1 MCP four helix bundle domain-containing protein [Pantoea allii]MBW1287830.1 MCP four helix bundle domain-containing protein [Pantoea allii]